MLSCQNWEILTIISNLPRCPKKKKYFPHPACSSRQPFPERCSRAGMTNQTRSKRETCFEGGGAKKFQVSSCLAKWSFLAGKLALERCREAQLSKREKKKKRRQYLCSLLFEETNWSKVRLVQSILANATRSQSLTAKLLLHCKLQ